MDTENRKGIVFGDSIIDFSIVRAFRIGLNKNWSKIDEGEKSPFYYILSVIYDSVDAENNCDYFFGNRNDVCKLILYLEKIEFINADLMPSVDKFLSDIKKRTIEMEKYEEPEEDDEDE